MVTLPLLLSVPTVNPTVVATEMIDTTETIETTEETEMTLTDQETTETAEMVIETTEALSTTIELMETKIRKEPVTLIVTAATIQDQAAETSLQVVFLQVVSLQVEIKVL